MKDHFNLTITAVSLILAMTPCAAIAQEETGEVIEEQVVLGRFLGSSQAMLLERQEDEAARAW